MTIKPWGSANYTTRRLNHDWDREREAAIYDAVFYAQDHAQLVAAAPFVRRFFLRELPPWSSCCDLGCGSGTWVASMLQDGKDVVGVDFSEGAHAVQQLGERYVHHDLTQPLELGRRFDVVTCWEVFEHLPREQHAALLNNVDTLDPHVLIMSCAGLRVTGRDIGELDPVYEKQKGRHHFSCMPLREFAELVSARGWVLDGLLSVLWRQVPKLPRHHRNNTLIFTRQVT